MQHGTSHLSDITLLLACGHQALLSKHSPELSSLRDWQLGRRGRGPGHIRLAPAPQAQLLAPALQAAPLAEQPQCGGAQRGDRLAQLDLPHSQRQLRVLRQVAVLQADRQRIRGQGHLPHSQRQLCILR